MRTVRRRSALQVFLSCASGDAHTRGTARPPAVLPAAWHGCAHQHRHQCFRGHCEMPCRATTPSSGRAATITFWRGSEQEIIVVVVHPKRKQDHPKSKNDHPKIKQDHTKKSKGPPQQ